MGAPWEKYGQAQPASAADGPWSKYSAPAESVPEKESGMLDTAGNFIMGGLRGAKDVIDTGALWLAKGFDKLAGTHEGERVQSMNDAGQAEFNSKYGDSTAAKVGRVGGQIAITLPVGGAIAAPVKSLAGAGVAPAVMTPVADAIATGGMRAAGAKGAAGLAARTVGGAVNGGATAALVDPDSAGAGAVIGAAMPGAFKAAGMAGNGIAGAVRPFFAAGQDKIAAYILKQYAADPNAALAALKAMGVELVPGSMPTTAAAAGDVGLAGLMRTLQNASPEFTNELTGRAAAQNAARTNLMEGIAGNAGKVATAKAERDAATDAMRESVLNRAGNIESGGILGSIDRMLSDPNNAGRIAQQALSNVRDQVAKFTAEDGTIPARALYALRKDINDVLGGKLQGEAGNLRHASGQLTSVKGLFDDAIDSASRSVKPSNGTAVVPYKAPLATEAQAAAMRAEDAASQPMTSWKDYLAKYTELSKPINQMEALQDVLKRVQTGTADTQGNLLLSAAKLNQILKNEGQELSKTLTPEQLQALRNLASDLNASQLAMNAGKATGSNTVQNLAQDQFLRQALGSVGGTSPVRMTLGNLLRPIYSRANQDIQQKLGDLLLNPAAAAKALEKASQTSVPMSALLNPATALAYRAAPLLPAEPR